MTPDQPGPDRERDEPPKVWWSRRMGILYTNSRDGVLVYDIDHDTGDMPTDAVELVRATPPAEDGGEPPLWTAGYERGWVDAHDQLVGPGIPGQQLDLLVSDLASADSEGETSYDYLAHRLFEIGYRKPVDPQDASRNAQTEPPAPASPTEAGAAGRCDDCSNTGSVVYEGGLEQCATCWGGEDDSPSSAAPADDRTIAPGSLEEAEVIARGVASLNPWVVSLMTEYDQRARAIEREKHANKVLNIEYQAALEKIGEYYRDIKRAEAERDQARADRDRAIAFIRQCTYTRQIQPAPGGIEIGAHAALHNLETRARTLLAALDGGGIR